MPSSIDPIERYRDLVESTPKLTPAEVRAPALAPLITQAEQAHQPVVDALASHVASFTTLTTEQAKNVVSNALPAQGTSDDKAQSVSTAVAAAAGMTADIEFSDPVMLWPEARLIFGALLTGVLVLSIVFSYLLANRSTGNAVSSATYVCLAIAGGLCLIGILVLVMGYKNVTIKGGSPSKS